LIFGYPGTFASLGEVFGLALGRRRERSVTFQCWDSLTVIILNFVDSAFGLSGAAAGQHQLVAVISRTDSIKYLELIFGWRYSICQRHLLQL